MRFYAKGLFMKQRIFTGLVLLAVLIPVIIFSDTFIFPAAAAICSVIGVYEVLACTGQAKHFALSIPALCKPWAKAVSQKSKRRNLTIYLLIVPLAVNNLAFLPMYFQPTHLHSFL